MSFSPDLIKPAQEVLIYRKISNVILPIIYFNNVKIQRASQQKYLEIILDEKLNFKCHIDNVLTKTSKGTAVIKILRNFLPCKSSITIYKAIIRPHFDYRDIPYDQTNSSIVFVKK